MQPADFAAAARSASDAGFDALRLCVNWSEAHRLAAQTTAIRACTFLWNFNSVVVALHLNVQMFMQKLSSLLYFAKI